MVEVTRAIFFQLQTARAVYRHGRRVFYFLLVKRKQISQKDTCKIYQSKLLIWKQSSLCIIWENCWHLDPMPPLVFPTNDVWEMTAEIPYWWRVTDPDLGTVNDLINAHFQINSSDLISVLFTLLEMSLITLPRRITPKYVLGTSKREQNHSIHSVYCLINKALRISSCPVSSSK